MAIVGALAKSQNKDMTRAEIAELAWEIENRDLKMFGGKQDQYASAFGGLNLFEFTDKVSVQAFDKKYAEALLPALVLMHTNIERKSATIQNGYKKLDSRQKKALSEIKGLVIPAIQAIGKSDTQTLGEILDTAWNFKKQSNKGITTPRISDIGQTAKKHGAIGFKICGAGGGGFMLFVIDPNKRESFIKGMELSGLTNWDFSPCYNGLETRIL